MHIRSNIPLVAFLFAVGLGSVAPVAVADVIDLASIKPFCPTPFNDVPVGGACTPNQQKLDGLKDATSCKGIGIEFDKEKAKCVVKGKAPAPQCSNVLPDLVVKGGVCVVDRQVPRSATGDYVGDYFHIKATRHDHPGLSYGTDTWLKVLSQQPLGTDDRLLTVIAVREPQLGGHGFKPIDQAETTTVRASDLIEVGATRVGWTYGVLALPFKFYANDKSLASGLSLGPYVGRRWGAPGSAYTLAAAAAIGSVKGEVRDAQDKITSTPDLQAFSVAVGAMWDISKSQNIKPFKIGLFVGVDSVSNDNVVKFKNNRKPWMAFQIGFDFTDN